MKAGIVITNNTRTPMKLVTMVHEAVAPYVSNLMPGEQITFDERPVTTMLVIEELDTERRN